VSAAADIYVPAEGKEAEEVAAAAKPQAQRQIQSWEEWDLQEAITLSAQAESMRRELAQRTAPAVSSSAAAADNMRRHITQLENEQLQEALTLSASLMDAPKEEERKHED